MARNPCDKHLMLRHYRILRIFEVKVIYIEIGRAYSYLIVAEILANLCIGIVAKLAHAARACVAVSSERSGFYLAEPHALYPLYAEM